MNKIPDYTKYINTQKFNKLTVENFKERLKQANLVSKTDFDEGANIKYVGGGAGGFYKFFKQKFHSPGDHRPKYFMAQ